MDQEINLAERRERGREGERERGRGGERERIIHRYTSKFILPCGLE